MGKTSVKIIDDSVSVKEVKQPKRKKVLEINIDRDRTLVEDKSRSAKTAGKVKLQQKLETNKESGVKQVSSEPESEVKKTAKNAPSNKDNQKNTRGKKYQQAREEVEINKNYPIDEAVELIKKISYTSFTGTLEAHINTIQTGLRGLISLPFMAGKKLKILAFGKQAEDCGADIVGSDNTLDSISKGNIDFDLVITTPDWMPKLAKLARFLGPKGLMPNPKNGTITDDLKKAVEGFQTGKTEYRTEPKASIIHLALGKLDQPTEELTANIRALFTGIGKSRVKKVTISPTMGPGVKLDLSSI